MNKSQSDRHPAGLWVLFTTELWERFAFYSMRAILVLYLVSISTGEDTPGLGWTESDAYVLYGWYTGLVYLSPLLGGWLADRFLGQRMCVIIGAVLMALGEFVLAATEFVRIGNVDVTMASDSIALWTFYAGLGLMILGNGFFKPCISVMVGQLYEPGDRRRDSGFTIFYMGINIGAFMSPLIGGTIGEIYGYQYGFLIAGFGMVLGLISFLMFGKYLKGIGDPPAKRDAVKKDADTERTPEEEEARKKALYEQTRLLDKKDYDRIFVIVILALFVMAFWIAFEQAGSSLNIFAKASTDRSVAASVQQVTPEWLFLKNEDFIEYQKVVHRIEQLANRIGREYDFGEGPTLADRFERFNIVGRIMTKDDEEVRPIGEQIAAARSLAAELRTKLRSSEDEETQQRIEEKLQSVAETDAAILDVLMRRLDAIAMSDATVAEQVAGVQRAAANFADPEGAFADKAIAAEKIREVIRRSPALTRILDGLSSQEAGSTAELEARRSDYLNEIADLVVDEQGRYGRQIQAALMTMEHAERQFYARYEEGVEPLTFPASWYQSVNPLYVVVFAPLFVLLWGFLARFGIEPSTPTKFALGLLLISVAFIVMIPGAIEAKHTGGRSAIYWLLLCYLFATWGELCLSPIGLSMITKLSPVRYVSQFMGVWFLASSLSYIMAGYMASYFGSGEGVTIVFGNEGGLADFFLLMAVIPAVIGFIALAMAPTLKRKMHGIQ